MILDGWTPVDPEIHEEREDVARVILTWLKGVCEGEAKARPVNDAISALHTQFKSQPTPPRIHIWED